MNLAAVVVRQVVRDRRALILMLVLPIAITAVVGIATQRADELRIGVTDSGSLLGDDLVAKLEGSPNIQVRSFDSAEDLRRAVLRGAVLAGTVIPPDYDTLARSGQQVSIPVVVGTGTDSQAARATLDSVIARQSAQIDVAIAGPSTTSFDDAFRAAGELAAQSNDVQVRTETTGGERVATGLAYSAPAMLVLFTFITSLTAAATLIEARRLGITRRVLASPTGVASIIAGIGLGRLLIAVAQSLVVLIGAAALGADWGDLIAGVALVIIFAIVSTAAGLLLATFTRNSQLAGSIGAPVGVALGMLGGCMWPLEVVGPTLSRIGHLTPHAWAMDGWLELGDGGFLGDLLPELGVLLVFAAVLIPLAMWRLRRSIASA